MSALDPYLEVTLLLHCHHPNLSPYNGHRIAIGFQSEVQAKEYYRLISQRDFTKTMELYPKRETNSVSLRLPSRVVQITASSKCSGFYIRFKGEQLAKEWQRALLLWEFVSSTTDCLYVERDIGYKKLNEMLHIPDKAESSGRRRPDHAQASRLREYYIFRFELETVS
ncbi:hypothetical protein F4825DRAFT_453575 [Nemania diffusa]|nr:hypothetical protein F4825DRAFT_453575 [Nemania diffusa]